MNRLLKVMCSRGWLVCIFVLLGLGFVPLAHAEYEISKSEGFSSNVPTDGTIVQMTDDIGIEWAQPTMMGDDILNGYIYKWNTSPTPLTDTLTITDNEGQLSPDVTIITKDAADFTDDDQNDQRYLHIRTWYTDATEGLSYSDDVVIGPINIDNVAPTGSVRITDADGTDITSTQSLNLDIRLSASLSPTAYQLSNDPGDSPAAGDAGTTWSTEATHTLTNSDPGEKTIYVWFRDSAGNWSTTPATDTVTLVSPVSISPYDPTLDLAIIETQVFVVDGNEDPYDWEITDPVPVESGVTVAQFSGNYTGTNTVTLQLLNAGTLKLRATPTGGGTALTSGTISVIESCIPGDVNESGTITPADASAAFQLYLTKDWSEMTTQERCAADFNESGSVTPADASAIFQEYLNQ